MPVTQLADPPATERHDPLGTGDVGGGDGPSGRGGDDPQPAGGMPPALAVAVIVLVAVVLTYLGMLSQILANISGAQLPGA